MEKHKKGARDSIKSTFVIDEFPDLPVGIIVGVPIRGERGIFQNFEITYWNAFAITLLTTTKKQDNPTFFNEVPYLNTLFNVVCEVWETGIPHKAELYDDESGNWIENSVYKNDEKCIIYLQNNTLNKINNKSLLHRLELESIIAGISSDFSSVTPDELDDCIIDSLAKIGRFNMADRAYTFNYSDDGDKMSCTHEWCAEGIEPTQPFFQNKLTQLYPWWHQQMINTEIIMLKSLDDLPLNAIGEKESLLTQGIQSLLVVPMIFDKKLVGFVGFDVVQQQRNWDKNDIDLLNTFADLLVTTSNRVSRELQLQRVNKRLEGVNRISNALLNSHLLDEQPDLTALRHIYDMIPCEVGIVFRIDKTKQIAYTDNRIRRGIREFWPGIQFPAEFLHNKVLSQGREQLINQLQADTKGFPNDFNPYLWGHRSLLAVPLLAHQHYVGLLILLDKTPDFFTQEHVLIAREVAGQLSIVLHQEDVNQQLTTQADKLNANNQLLQAVINNISASISLLQPIRQDSQIVDFTYLLANPETELLSGLNHSEIIGYSLRELFPHVVTNSLFDRLIYASNTGQLDHFQMLTNLPNGKYWFDYSLIPVGDTILLTAKNISTLKQVEEELRETNTELEKRVADRTAQIQQLSALQRAILKYAGLAISAMDTRGTIQLVNPALEAMSGYRADELVGKVTPDFIGQPTVFLPRINLLTSNQTGDELVDEHGQKPGLLQQENAIHTKQGTYIPVLTTSSGLYDEDDNLIGYVNLATDISYLKRVEQELKQANQRIQLATIAGKLGIWEWILPTNEVTVDENFYPLFGIASTDSIRQIMDVAKLVHPADLAFFNQNVQQIISEQKPFEAEFRIIFPADKSIHFMKADGLVLQNEAGTSNRIIGVVSDQTAQKLADSALRESEQRYRSLVDHLTDIVFEIDVIGSWAYLNPAWQSITGFSVEESLGKPFLDSVFADDVERNRHLCEELMNRQKPYCQHVVRYIHKEGGFRWIGVFAQITVDEYDEITGITGTLTDITERKKFEEALWESEQRFRDIAENVDEIFWIRDLMEPRFIYMNSAYERFSGQSPQELYNNPFLFLDFILEEDRQKVMNAFLHREPDLGFQFRARHQDGSIRWLDVQIFTVKDEIGQIKRRIGMATDITTSIEKEQILEESLKNERNLNYLKSQFISTASHEFRTPLATISSSVELLKYYVNMPSTGAARKSINQHIDKIYREVFELNDLISNTLTISKIEEGQTKAHLESMDLVALCNDIVNSHFSDRHDKRSIDFTVIGYPVTINSDKKLIDHILKNLVSNAFKFSAGNPELKLVFEKNTIALYIIDEGIGVPESDIPNLFRKFFRARNASTIQGTGLGLAICQEYASLLNGCISVESKEGAGTAIIFTFPLLK